MIAATQPRQSLAQAQGDREKIPVKKDSSIPSDIHQRPFMRLQ